MYRLNSAVNRFVQELDSLSEAERDEATEIIIKLTELIEISRHSADKEHISNELKSIRIYLAKKVSKANPKTSSGHTAHSLLVRFRNELSHGPSHRKYSTSDTKSLAATFWKILELSAPRWDPHELLNILAYCLDTYYKPSRDSDLDSKKIIRIYKTIFNNFNEDQKMVALSELLLRFRSEPAFKGALESMMHI